jgi:hypothetical protein
MIGVRLQVGTLFEVFVIEIEVEMMRLDEV